MFQSSVVLYVLELFRAGNGLAESLPIFDMARISADSRIKYVAKGVFSQKLERYHSHTLGIFIFRPQISKVGYGVYALLFTLQVVQKLLIVDIVKICYSFYLLSILLYVAYDGFAIVFGYVLCFVF